MTGLILNSGKLGYSESFRLGHMSTLLLGHDFQHSRGFRKEVRDRDGTIRGYVESSIE